MEVYTQWPKNVCRPYYAIFITVSIKLHNSAYLFVFSDAAKTLNLVSTLLFNKFTCLSIDMVFKQHIHKFALSARANYMMQTKNVLNESLNKDQMCHPLQKSTLLEWID